MILLKVLFHLIMIALTGGIWLLVLFVWFLVAGISKK